LFFVLYVENNPLSYIE